MIRNHALLAIIFTLTSFPSTSAQASFRPDRMDTVLYGAAYYPEYMPYGVSTDVELMKQAGISVVCMGESSWGLWEPEDGRFEYAWMDRVVEQMHKSGSR
jgi:beta-galactosidase